MASRNLTDSETASKMASQSLSDITSLLSTTSGLSLLLSGAALVVAMVSYLAFAGSRPAASSSRKAQQARAMREAYKSMEKQSAKPNSKKPMVSFMSIPHGQADVTQESKAGAGSMQISQVGDVLIHVLHDVKEYSYGSIPSSHSEDVSCPRQC